MSSLLAPKNDTDVACYSPERRLARIFQEALDKQSNDASSRFSPKELLACAQTLINDLLDNGQRDTNKRTSKCGARKRVRSKVNAERGQRNSKLRKTIL